MAYLWTRQYFCQPFFLYFLEMVRKIYIGVIGAGDCSEEIYSIAGEVGFLIGENDWTLVCGGLGGVMEGAAKGCNRAGGTTIGILPGHQKNSANPFITIPIPTGLGEARNILVTRVSDVLVAIAGGYGTLSEIGFALKIEKPVIGLKTWPGIAGIDYVETPLQAIEAVKKYFNIPIKNSGG